MVRRCGTQQKCRFSRVVYEEDVQKPQEEAGDFDWKYSKKTIPVYMPEAELVIRPGFQHCGYMAANPKEYAEELEAFIRKQRNVLG